MQDRRELTLNGLYGGGNKDPNGTWSLYFNLNLHAQPGTINGWCLQLTQNAPDVSVVKSHSGNFRQGDIGDTYTVAVSNAGPGKTGGTLTLTDTLPAALTATAMSGSGWDCTGNTFPAAGPTTLTCTSTSQIAAGSGYPAVTLTVNVANNARQASRTRHRLRAVSTTRRRTTPRATAPRSFKHPT